MKLEGIQAMVDMFDLNNAQESILPQEVISTTPSRELKARLYPREIPNGRTSTRLLLIRSGPGWC